MGNPDPRKQENEGDRFLPERLVKSAWVVLNMSGMPSFSRGPLRFTSVSRENLWAGTGTVLVWFSHAVLPGPLRYLLGQWDRVDTDTSMEERVWFFVLS